MSEELYQPRIDPSPRDKGRRELQLLAGAKHTSVTRAGVEPDVHNVPVPCGIRYRRNSDTLCLPAAAPARPDKPAVRPLTLEDVGHMLDRRLVHQRVVAAAAIEDRDRHAPGPLPRDAPVAAPFDHIVQPHSPQFGVHLTPRISSSIRSRNFFNGSKPLLVAR